MKTQETEFKGMKLSGFLMLFVFFLLVGGAVCSFVFMDNIGMAFGITSGIICIVASIILLCGFVMVEPNEARVVMFFGKYEGTFTKMAFTGSILSTALKRYRSKPGTLMPSL